MKVTTFTDMMIRKLKPDVKEIRKSEGNGFTIRVMPSGVKTWLYLYTIYEKRRCLNLGQYPDVSLETARNKFDDARKQVKNGIDPLATMEQEKEERRNAPTVEDICKDYINKHAMKNKKSWKEDQRALNKEVIPVLGMHKAADIRKRDIILLLEAVVERNSPIMANRLRSLLQKMFNFAVEKDMIEHSPCAGIKQLVKETPKERVLDECEIKTLWNVLDDKNLMMSDQTRRALKLILLTAQRPGEVIGMHTREISGKWWTIPTERSKNKRANRVYLTDTALELIGDTKGKDYIFPAVKKVDENEVEKETGSMNEKALAFALRRNIKGQSIIKDKVKRRKGTEYKRGPYKAVKQPATDNVNRIGVEAFTPHDLRRTAATLMAAIKIPFETRERVLNHKLSKMDSTYNQHDYDDEKQVALETLERKLNGIITGT